VPAAAARHGDAELLAALTTVGRGAGILDQEIVASTLAWFGDPELVRRGFRWALDGGIDDAVLFWLVYGPRNATEPLRRRLIEENLDLLIARTPAKNHVDLVSTSGWLCDAAGREWFARVFGPRAGKMADGAGAYADKLAQIDQCLEVARRHQPGLAAWLKR
jgi:hypothetical protein